MSNSSPCICGHPPFHFSDYESRELGEDSASEDVTTVSIEKCKHCGRYWLRYLLEQPEFSKSGRWWRVPIDSSNAETIEADDARSYIEQQVEGFVGGSYFESRGFPAVASITVR
jgi:hypothetical protein